MRQPFPDLPHLQIVATAGLHPHEHPDQQRAEPLKRALAEDGVLRNPPIVLPIEGRAGEYVVLDGANRVTALQMLDVPHTLVQVAHPNGDELHVQTWNHVLMSESADHVMGILNSLNGYRLKESSPDKALSALESGESLINVLVPRGGTYRIQVPADSLPGRIRALDEFVAAYAGRVPFERTSAAELEGLLEVYPELACLVVFPSFEAEEVVAGAVQGLHFPPGITRFIVSPRALRLNYPLARLSGDRSLEEKQAELEAWIRERKRNRRVRYYAESTFLFDE